MRKLDGFTCIDIFCSLAAGAPFQLPSRNKYGVSPSMKLEYGEEHMPFSRVSPCSPTNESTGWVVYSHSWRLLSAVVVIVALVVISPQGVHLLPVDDLHLPNDAHGQVRTVQLGRASPKDSQLHSAMIFVVTSTTVLPSAPLCSKCSISDVGCCDCTLFRPAETVLGCGQ